MSADDNTNVFADEDYFSKLLDEAVNNIPLSAQAIESPVVATTATEAPKATQAEAVATEEAVTEPAPETTQAEAVATEETVTEPAPQAVQAEAEATEETVTEQAPETTQAEAVATEETVTEQAPETTQAEAVATEDDTPDEEMLQAFKDAFAAPQAEEAPADSKPEAEAQPAVVITADEIKEAMQEELGIKVEKPRKPNRLDEVRATKESSTKFMVDEITKVCKTFGKRDPGSNGEKQAVDYMAQQLGELCEDVKVEPFDVYPASFMGWIYISVALLLAGFACYFFLPIITLVSIVVAMVLMLGQFILYRQMIDKLFTKKTSYNVTAIKKCSGEVKRRLFFNGHPDAACEWTFNYHLGGAGFIAHFLFTMVGVIYLFAITIFSLIENGLGFAISDGTLAVFGYVGFAFIPFWVAMFWLWNEKRIVDGANDNLTGCYMGIAILKAMKEQNIDLEHTEVGVIITGSEEAGLRGAKAWTKAHAGEFKDVETLIFAYDTIHESRHLCVNVKDLNSTVKADEGASKLFKGAADKLGIHCSTGTVPLGATDSAAFCQGGFRATGITGLDHNLQDYYHTRKDSYDNLNEQGLSDCFEISVEALKEFDEQ